MFSLFWSAFANIVESLLEEFLCILINNPFETNYLMRSFPILQLFELLPYLVQLLLQLFLQLLQELNLVVQTLLRVLQKLEQIGFSFFLFLLDCLLALFNQALREL